MDYNELEKLVIDNLLGGFDLGELEGENKYSEFSVVALCEWSNDEDHYYPDVSMKEWESDYYQKYDKPAIEKFIKERTYKEFQFGCNDLLVYLLYLKVIPEGNYLIRVSW